MTAQAKIAALATELTRIGKMPSWISIGRMTGRPLIEAADSYDALEVMPEAVLATLAGVAAEVLPNHGYMIVRSGKTDSGESDEEGNIIWSDWCWDLYKHNWGNGDDYLGPFDTYHEAIWAALKRIENEVKK